MAGEKRFTRIPPESTGDRVWMVAAAQVGFEGQSDPNYQWQIGSTYTISGNGGPTMMVHVHGVNDEGTTGSLSVHYSKSDVYNNVVPIAGQSVTDPDGITVIATTTTPINDVYIPGQNIVGYDNPDFGLDVDNTGSANIRFAEGLPQLDAWGKLRVSGGTQLGDYVFGQEQVFTDNFSPVRLSGGYATYSNTRHSVQVGVDNTVDPANGFASSSSNQYHHYVAGSSHLWAGTALLNSPATTGNIRQWGLFDANNGFMFRVGTGGTNATDATGLSAVVRSNIPSAPQKDTVIPRSDWNGDKLDGTGDSQVTLDLSKVNLWWIDVQWHGAGRVRFGVYEKGQRVVCHSYYQRNEYAQAMSQTASLPACFSCKSTLSSASNLYIETWSAAVWTESDIDLRAYGAPATYASPYTAVTANITDSWQRLFALSPRELHANGEVNHSLYVPTSISAYAFNDTGAAVGQFDAADAIIDLKMEINGVDNGNVFTQVAATNVEVSTAGNSFEGGKVILQDMFKGRYDSILTDTFNNLQYGAVKNFPDDGGTVENTIATISAGSPAVMTTTARINVREPMTVTFPFNAGGYTITGTDNASYDDLVVYVKPISVNSAELYSDAGLTTPISLGSATGGNIKGFQGSRVIWSFFVKTRTAYYPSAKIMVIVNWKELIQ